MKQIAQAEQKKQIQIGGTRNIETIDTDIELILDSENNPITEKIINPKIEGAIVIAEGRRKCNNKNKYNSSSICSNRTSNTQNTSV